VFPNSAASRARRMAATRPSIMSEGATMSMPARASETEVRASNSSVGSLRISYSAFAMGVVATAAPSACGPAFTIPQWPCDIYSQRHTSPIKISPGTSRLIARTACCTIPSSAHAPVATSSLLSGNPNRITAGTPSECTSCASFTASSTDKLNTPGIDRISFRTPSPPHTNIG
jgi:hypothetical protein